jgi:hypothetical protein
MSTPESNVIAVGVVGQNLQFTIPAQPILTAPPLVISIPLAEIAQALAPYITGAMPS